MKAFSLMAAAAATMAAAQYQPNWASLDARPLPAWYDQAKVGIFMHWGVYSVPSWGTPSGGASGEWFWWEWQGADNPEYIAFVNNTEPPGWSYADYGPQFTASLWNATQWAELISASGVRYAVLTSKHHEGWTNWPSAQSWQWNSMDNGPHRDLVGELFAALRSVAPNVTPGLYYSLFEWFNPLYLADRNDNFTTNVYVEQVMMPQLMDIVNSYQPQLIWSDGDWEAYDTYWQSTNFLAWLYNESPVRDTVVVNDRWGIGDTCAHGGYYTCSDRYTPNSLPSHKWEDAFTLDQFSWGFRRNMNAADVLTPQQMIGTIIRTVALGGNALMNVGPTHDGTIAPIFQERLLQLGAWLGVVGEPSIYASSPWRVQNDTAAMTTWYTTKGGNVFAHLTVWPNAPNVTLYAPVSSAQTTVSLLGLPGNLPWVPYTAKNGITVTLPQLTPATDPTLYAWTLQLTNVS